MAFPTVSTVNYSEETVDITTHDVAIPSAISAGDLLILWVALNGNTVTEPTITGWTKLHFLNGAGTITIGIWYKFASGSETNFTYTSSVSEQSANRTWRVTGTHASSPPETVAGGTNGFSASCGGFTGSNPMVPSWGADDTMFINFGVFNTAPTISAYPANYTDNQFTDNSGAPGSIETAGLVTASRNINTASESPPTFTLSSAVSQMGKTVAIRPAAAGGATSIDPMGMRGFFGA